MRISANLLEQAINDKRAWALQSETDSFIKTIQTSPDNMMDQIMTTLSEIDELCEQLSALKMITEIKVHGETYTVYQAIRFVMTLEAMSKLWMKSSYPQRFARWASLANYQTIFGVAIMEAEDKMVDIDIDPVLFKGTSIQEYVDSQVL